MSRYTDLDINQQVTADMVAEDGVLVTISREGDVEEDGAGGFRPTSDDFTPRLPVRVWLHGATLNVRSGNTRQFFQDAAGDRYQVKYVLVGPPDLDVMEGDRLQYLGQELKVLDVHPDRSFETRAQVIGWSDGDGTR